MRRALRILAWTAGVVVGLIVVAVAAGYFFVTSDNFRGRVESSASAYSGRKTKIAKIAIDWGATAHVRLDGVEVANPDWAKEPAMLKADAIDFDIRLWPLIKGDFVLPRLLLNKPVVDVEMGDKEQLNWSSGEAPATTTAAQAVTPKNRFETPLIGRLEIDDGRIAYHDNKRNLELEGTIATATGKAGAQPTAELQLKGKLANEPLVVHFVGGSALMLRNTDQPYPIDLDVAYGATKLTAKGTLEDPIQWKGADVDLTLAGPDLADIYPLLGIPGPPTPPYRISGKLDREPGVWKFVNTKWHAGDSDLSGDILVDERKKPSSLTAKLVSQHLAFADLAPLVGAPPGKRGNVSPQQRATEQRLEATGDLFPNVPLHVEKLRAMNMDVTLDARRVVAPDYLPVQALSFRVLVESGRATVKPFNLALIGGGTVAGDLGVDAAGEVPKVHAALRGTNMELGMFFRNSKYFDTTRGRIEGQVMLTGYGRSLAQVMSVADGHVDVALGGGSVSSLMVSLAGLQIFDALILYVTGDNRIPILCALGRLDFRHGVVTFDRTLLDTQKSVLRVDGTVALPTQLVNVAVRAYPKSFDLLDLHGPVVVQGKIRQPAIRIARAIPIPTPVFGDAKTVACPQLTRQLFTGQ
ncbi:MAG: AsmA family protein [Alphaproteobacteria bacterium]|nr:AsmA family protein [Alphaproteobacteria bacterium]